jgi:hypothetical protein
MAKFPIYGIYSVGVIDKKFGIVKYIPTKTHVESIFLGVNNTFNNEDKHVYVKSRRQAIQKLKSLVIDLKLAENHELPKMWYLSKDTFTFYVSRKIDG